MNVKVRQQLGVGDVLLETSAKFCLNVENMKFNTQNADRTYSVINYVYNFTLCISVHHGK